MSWFDIYLNMTDEKRKKIVVTSPIGKEDFSIPKEFDEKCEEICKKPSITKKEFLEYCKEAVKFKEKYPDQKQGIAYNVTGVWLYLRQNQPESVVEEVGQSFGILELPDHQVEPNVDEAWRKVSELIDKKLNGER